MNATFNEALRYFVDVVCESPLRTGGADNETASILMDFELRPFVQGTSLAGAFRSWQDDSKLFGDVENRSPLMFSDLLMEQTEPVFRPRLRINKHTGTAAGSAKFDIAAIPVHTRGSFQLIWTGNDDPVAIAARVEEYLSALNSGEITLGAQKSNGFGRVSVTAKRRIYHMNCPEDLNAWLEGAAVTDAQPIVLQSRMKKDVLFTVTASVPAVLAKGSSPKRGSSNPSTKHTGGMIFTQMEESGRKIIPGSSLKGSIRGQMARICNILKYEPEALERLFGHENRKGKGGGAAGVLRFSDGILRETKLIQVPRIRINRLTGGIIQQGMFKDEPVHGELTFEIRIPATHKAGCALLLYALRDLGLGLYELGSGASVGRGRVSDIRVCICHRSAKAELHCSAEGVTLCDPDSLIADWENALKERAVL